MPLYRTGNGIRHLRPDNHPARHTGTCRTERTSIPVFGNRGFLYLTFLGAIKWGTVMLSPLLHKTIFFSESCLGDLMLYVAVKINLRGPEIGMAIFGFCQHQHPFLRKKCWDDDITYPSRKVGTSLYSGVGRWRLWRLRVKSSLIYITDVNNEF